MRPFYVYKLLTDFLLIAPVMVPFYRASHLTATQMFAVQAVYSVSQLLSEIPSGYLADVVGRRRTLILGSALFLAGLALYALSDGFWQFALAELVLGIGGGMRSGTDSALLWDTLKEQGRTDRYTQMEGRAEALTRLGTALSAVLGGVLAGVALRLPFWANVGTGVILLGASCLLREPARDELPRGNPLTNIASVVRESLSDARVRVVMLLWALVLATGLTAIWGYFLYQGAVGLPLATYGVAFAAVQLCSALGAHRSSRLQARLGPPRSLLLVVGIGAVLGPFAMLRSAWMVPLACVHAFVWGFSTPLFLERLNRLTSSAVRATTLSTGAMMGRVFYITLSLGFGVVADHVSLSAAFGALALVYSAGAALLALALWRQDRTAPAAMAR